MAVVTLAGLAILVGVQGFSNRCDSHAMERLEEGGVIGYSMDSRVSWFPPEMRCEIVWDDGHREVLDVP